MTTFDLSALSEALPPQTMIVVSGNLLRIGDSYTCTNDADAFADPLAHWPSAVTSPEEMVAFCYVQSLLQQKMGATYAVAVANETLPAWSPGEDISQ